MVMTTMDSQSQKMHRVGLYWSIAAAIVAILVFFWVFRASGQIETPAMTSPESQRMNSTVTSTQEPWGSSKPWHQREGLRTRENANTHPQRQRMNTTTTSTQEWPVGRQQEMTSPRYENNSYDNPNWRK